MRDVASRAYAEMVAAGYGAVGEFHYVHHRPDGRSYDDPNAMAHAVAEAASAAGLTIALIPAAYHRNGWDGEDRPPQAGQRRFCDPDVETFLARVDALREWAGQRPNVSVGIAAHSVRAVPHTWLEAIAATPRTTASSATSTPTSSGASSRNAAPSTAARRSSCCTEPAS